MGKPELSLEGVGAFGTLDPLEWGEGTEKRIENLLLLYVHVIWTRRQLTNLVLNTCFDFFQPP